MEKAAARFAAPRLELKGRAVIEMRGGRVTLWAAAGPPASLRVGSGREVA